jgi:sugar (pentulose or hexulose) kinase
MDRIPVIAIFDIGKTNKKLFCFDEYYKILHEQQVHIAEITDEDGDPCEDLEKLTAWIANSMASILRHRAFEIRAVNFCSYGASFVHLDENGKPLTPLYSYLKPYPPELSKKFYQEYGGAISFSMITASPVLGSLNSGMQLYRLRNLRPDIFQQIKYSLHLPQYIAYLLSNQYYSDITSIGCHTNLWNFAQNNYHEWVYREGLLDKLAPVVSSNHTDWINIQRRHLLAGVGLHDSSAALIPYLESFIEPFVLVSTGTWCIGLNPFNKKPLTVAELEEDCLCYLSFQGKPVKASRIFAGYHHEQEEKKLSSWFQKPADYYSSIVHNPEIIDLLKKSENIKIPERAARESLFHNRELSAFKDYEEAYHQLMMDILTDQKHALNLILEGLEVKRIFVDGGFGKNNLYMQLLAESFPQFEVFAAYAPQATALGAALAIHHSWNKKSLPNDIIELRLYRASHVEMDT